MRVIVTGATGFIGSYLMELLCRRGDEVHGTYLAPPPFYLTESLFSRADGVCRPELVYCDVRERNQVDHLVQEVKPDRIYHLAAQSLPTLSWKEPALTIETNVIGTVNTFEAVRNCGLETRILVACSSAEYGFSPDVLPIGEDFPLLPLHPYGFSKVAQDLLAYQYFQNFRIPTVRI